MIEVIRRLRLHACAFLRVNQWPNYCSENISVHSFLCAIGIRKIISLVFILLWKLFSFFIYWNMYLEEYSCVGLLAIFQQLCRFEGDFLLIFSESQLEFAYKILHIPNHNWTDYEGKLALFVHCARCSNWSWLVKMHSLQSRCNVIHPKCNKNYAYAQAHETRFSPSKLEYF